MAFTYGGKFEKHINDLYSPKNIQKTAKKFAEYEEKHGPYKFGQQYTKMLVPKKEHWQDDKGSTAGHGRGKSTPATYLRISVTSLPGSSGRISDPKNHCQWS